MKILKTTGLLSLALILSACTNMERFSTEKVLQDEIGENIARLKVTTNTYNVFAVPNSQCIDLTKAVKVNGKIAVDPERSKKGFFEKLFTAQRMYEEQGKSLNMPKVNLGDIVGYKEAYISQEYAVAANKPITLFIKKQGEMLGLLFNKSEDVYGFAGSFVPEKNKDYQFVITSNTDSTMNGSITYYEMKLFDITEGKAVYLNSQLDRVGSCK